MKKNEEWMHYFDDPENKYFVVCNVTNLTEIQTWKLMIPYESNFIFDTVQMKNVIYFTGGGVPPAGSSPAQYFKILYKFTLLPEMKTTTNKLADMNIARANHSMISVTNNSLYVVGGANSEGCISSCEEYLLDKNKWRQIASLNEAKKCVSICKFKSKYLYAFGGLTNDKDASTEKIEMFDTADTTSKLWNIVTLASGAALWKKSVFAGTFELSPNEILLFGGLYNGKEVDYCLTFNPEAKSMTSSGKIQRLDTFYKTKYGISGTQMAIVGSHDGDLHIFDKEKKTWVLMRKVIWNPLTSQIRSDTF